jgi:hypothetical protein
MERAGVDPQEIDLIILATITGDYPNIPASASLVQNLLGIKCCGAFDLVAGCSGFVCGLVTGSQFIQTGACRNVLVIGAESMSRVLDWSDRTTCVLFGDAAGAVVLRPTEKEGGLPYSEIDSLAAEPKVRIDRSPEAELHGRLRQIVAVAEAVVGIHEIHRLRTRPDAEGAPEAVPAATGHVHDAGTVLLSGEDGGEEERERQAERGGAHCRSHGGHPGESRSGPSGTAVASGKEWAARTRRVYLFAERALACVEARPARTRDVIPSRRTCHHAYDSDSPPCSSSSRSSARASVSGRSIGCASDARRTPLRWRRGASPSWTSPRASSRGHSPIDGCVPADATTATTRSCCAG